LRLAGTMLIFLPLKQLGVDFLFNLKKQAFTTGA
jgi:hypothetical protein